MTIVIGTVELLKTTVEALDNDTPARFLGYYRIPVSFGVRYLDCGVVWRRSSGAHYSGYYELADNVAEDLRRRNGMLAAVASGHNSVNQSGQPIWEVVL